jgi:hypothetical protein
MTELMQDEWNLSRPFGALTMRDEDCPMSSARSSDRNTMEHSNTAWHKFRAIMFTIATTERLSGKYFELFRLSYTSCVNSWLSYLRSCGRECGDL